MAQGQNNASAMWAESAARNGFAVANGVPHIGISPDEGDGFIVPVPAPAWFAHVPSEGERDNVSRALLAHALRVGQAKVKSEDKPTREHASAGVASVIDGSYKPSRDRSNGNDIVETEAMRRFIAVNVRPKVLEKVPAATDKQIEDTAKAQAETERGKALLAEHRAAVLESGTYTPARKGGAKAGALAIEL
jgi:hypothetical protein